MKNNIFCILFNHKFEDYDLGINRKNSLEHHRIKKCKRCNLFLEKYYNAYTGSADRPLLVKKIIYNKKYKYKLERGF